MSTNSKGSFGIAAADIARWSLIFRGTIPHFAVAWFVFDYLTGKNAKTRDDDPRNWKLAD